MVFTLHRYIFRELIRVFTLATVALTAMLSLGSILRPVQEFGVGPQQVLHLMGYFLPITLTFVLPLAALFAASLVYGRFACDNELDACRASGISLMTLVYPGLILAIIVAIANLILSFHVMPAFVKRAEKAIKADARQIVFRNIQRKGYYKPSDGKYVIYADNTDLRNSTLSGVIITEVENNQIERIITAHHAQLSFVSHELFNKLQITTFDTHQIGTGNQGWFSVERMALSKEFPALLSDDIKFKKIDEMKKIRLDPLRFYPIAKQAEEVYARFITELLVQDISDTITNPGNNFYRMNSGDRIIEFTAGSCRIELLRKIELSGRIVLNEYDWQRKKLLRNLRCSRAWIHIEGDQFAPTLTIEMYNPTWTRPDGSQGLAARPFIRGLILPNSITNKFAGENVLDAISPEALSQSLKAGPGPELRNLRNQLQARIDRTMVKINAEIQSRLVFGMGCVSMIMIGIALGIIKKDSHLLSAFAASCVPAAILIVCIMMGKNIAKNPDSSVDTGIFLMWTGLALLSLTAVAIYRRLLKH